MSRLFEALRDAADGTFVIDEDLRIVFWNKTAEAILGFDSEDAVGQFCYQLLHGYDEGRHLICKARCQVAKLASKSKPVPNYDIHVTTKQGANRFPPLLMAPILAPQSMLTASPGATKATPISLYILMNILKGVKPCFVKV